MALIAFQVPFKPMNIIVVKRSKRRPSSSRPSVLIVRRQKSLRRPRDIHSFLQCNISRLHVKEGSSGSTRVWEFGLSAVVPRTTNERCEAVEEDTPAGPRIAANDDHSLLMRITLGERHAQVPGCGRFCPLAPSCALVRLSGSHHLYYEAGESTSPQPAAGVDDSAVGHLRVW